MYPHADHGQCCLTPAKAVDADVAQLEPGRAFSSWAAVLMSGRAPGAVPRNTAGYICIS